MVQLNSPLHILSEMAKTWKSILCSLSVFYYSWSHLFIIPQNFSHHIFAVFSYIRRKFGLKFSNFSRISVEFGKFAKKKS